MGRLPFGGSDGCSLAPSVCTLKYPWARYRIRSCPCLLLCFISNLILKKCNRGENKVEIFSVLKQKKNFANVPNVITSDLRRCGIT